MNNSSVLSRVNVRLFKITINNGRVELPDSGHSARLYEVKHLYLSNFSRAKVNISVDRVEGEVEYADRPAVNFLDDDVLTISMGAQPAIKRVFSERIFANRSGSRLAGEFDPLSIRVSDEGSLVVHVNNKFIYSCEEAGVAISGFSSILNMLIYPFKLAWIYSPRARMDLINENNRLLVNIEELSN